MTTTIDMTAQEYLTAHGISEEFATQQGLTWDDKELHIPVFENNEGDIAFHKHRNLQHDSNNPESAKYRYDSGSHATLFNYHAVKERSYIVIAEGEMDCLKLMQEGIPSVSSTGGSKTWLSDWSALVESKQLFVCYDTDRAGQEGIKKILEELPEAKVIVLPTETKDICDWFMAGHTKQEFIELMRAAQTKKEWEQANYPEDFKLLSMDEMVMMDFPEEPWILDKIIYSSGFCFLYGGEGTGKSFLTLSIANAVATGQPWLGQFKVAKPRKVLFIDKENPLSLIAKRAIGLGIATDNIKYLKYPEKLQLTNNKGELSPFSQALSNIVATEDIGLIIIDSFVDLMVGSENKAEDTQSFFDALRQLFPNTAMLVLHHENKPTQGVFRSDSQRMRGSSNINAQTNTQFRLEPVAKSKTELTLKQTKARDAQKLDKFMVRMVVEEDNIKGGTKVTGFEYVGVIQEDEDSSKTEEVENRIIEMLGAGPGMTRQAIIDDCATLSVSEKTVQRALKGLVSSNQIEELRQGRTKFYVIVSQIVMDDNDSGQDE